MKEVYVIDRRRKKEGDAQRKLANEYRVSRSTISDAVSYRTWSLLSRGKSGNSLFQQNIQKFMFFPKNEEGKHTFLSNIYF